MKSTKSFELVAAAKDVDLISTDVFDTLLLRTIRSERSRILKAERRFASLLAQRGWHLSADLLVDTRLQAQQLAFRALVVGNVAHEVRLVDIIRRQLMVLGLPVALVSERLQIELEVEKGSLAANKALGHILRVHRRSGRRIVAVSDTTLPSEGVRELIQHFHGDDIVDHIYCSADHGLTKRDGTLFPFVAEAENVPVNRILHIGDDPLADMRVPSTKGLKVYHTPRNASLRYLRSANGALSETKRFVRKNRRATAATAPLADDAFSFGRNIFGPIVTQFCLMIWLYAAQAEVSRRPVLLFCARGGVGIREAFERVLTRLNLPLDARRENVMISRLVAARAALLAQSNSAIEELAREFRGRIVAEVAQALGGRPYELSQEWQQPFQGKKFLALLFGESGQEVLSDIKKQNALFTRHFEKVTGVSDRQILCDTGLYGSTQRLLASGFPNAALETIQFARSNYKGYSEEHFPRVTGLLVQQNFYNPLNVYSCILRYWHLIESLFEPSISSVRLFTEDKDGKVIANCGSIDFSTLDPSAGNHLLTGALAYIDALPPNGGAVALREAEVAWLRLKHAVINPSDSDLRSLEVGSRSVDFGRPDVLRVINLQRNSKFTSRLMSIKPQLWREGAIAREFPILKHALLPLWGSAQSVRGLLMRTTHEQ